MASTPKEFGLSESVREQVKLAGFSLNAEPWAGPAPQERGTLVPTKDEKREAELPKAEAQARLTAALASVSEMLPRSLGTAKYAELLAQQRELQTTLEELSGDARATVSAALVERMVQTAQAVVSVAETTAVLGASLKVAAQTSLYSVQEMRAIQQELYESDPVYRMQTDAIRAEAEARMAASDARDVEYNRMLREMGITTEFDDDVEKARAALDAAKGEGDPLVERRADASLQGSRVAQAIAAVEEAKRLNKPPEVIAVLEAEVVKRQEEFDKAMNDYDKQVAITTEARRNLLVAQGASPEEIEAEMAKMAATNAQDRAALVEGGSATVVQDATASQADVAVGANDAAGKANTGIGEEDMPAVALVPESGGVESHESDARLAATGSDGALAGIPAFDAAKLAAAPLTVANVKQEDATVTGGDADVGATQLASAPLPTAANVKRDAAPVVGLG